MPKTKFVRKRHWPAAADYAIMERIVNWFNENFLLASLFWGSIAIGYLIYGWKQKTLMPFLGGLAMTAAHSSSAVRC